MPTKKPESSRDTTVVINNTVVTGGGTVPKPRRRRKQSPTEKLKRKIARVTGIPTTSSGRKKKAERVVADFLIDQIDKIGKDKK